VLLSYKLNVKERYIWDNIKQYSSATYWKTSGIEEIAGKNIKRKVVGRLKRS
jgi:hypothetical protein